VLFVPTEILLMQVELDWRRHQDPVEFLSRWLESPYQEMAAGEKRTLPHEQEAGASCATASTIATATGDSQTQLWAEARRGARRMGRHTGAEPSGPCADSVLGAAPELQIA